MDFKQLRTVKQLAAESGGVFTQGALRWMLFNSERNGLESAVVRVGRRVLVDADAFGRWLECQRSGKCATDRRI